MTAADRIKEKLTEAFRPDAIEVVDESHLHKGHAGHRPTWTMGVNADGAEAAKLDPNRAWAAAFTDPFGIFGGGHQPRSEKAAPEPRPLRNLERKSFAVLDLDGSEEGTEIKARYKALVKQLHPDANGGDRSSEDRLRQIIQAYHYLKSAGFC